MARSLPLTSEAQYLHYLCVILSQVSPPASFCLLLEKNNPGATVLFCEDKEVQGRVTSQNIRGLQPVGGNL